MNTRVIREALDRLERSQRALAWLHEHSHKLTSDPDLNMFTVTFAPLMAGGCHGAMEAALMVSETLSLEMDDHLQRTIDRCQSIIAAQRAIILEELGHVEA